MLSILLIVTLNTLIAFANAASAGYTWDVRGTRLLNWCGLVQSVIGFSCLPLVLDLPIVMQLAKIYAPDHVHDVGKFMMASWYVAIIAPCLGTGVIILVHSWLAFLRRPTWLGGVETAWNSYAMYSNVKGVVDHGGEMFGAVGDGIGKIMESDSDSAEGAGFKLVLLLALVAVFVALGLGVLFTLLTFRWARNHALAPAVQPARARTA